MPSAYEGAKSILGSIEKDVTASGGDFSGALHRALNEIATSGGEFLTWIDSEPNGHCSLAIVFSYTDLQHKIDALLQAVRACLTTSDVETTLQSIMAHGFGPNAEDTFEFLIVFQCVSSPHMEDEDPSLVAKAQRLIQRFIACGPHPRGRHRTLESVDDLMRSGHVRQGEEKGKKVGRENDLRRLNVLFATVLAIRACKEAS